MWLLFKIRRSRGIIKRPNETPDHNPISAAAVITWWLSTGISRHLARPRGFRPGTRFESLRLWAEIATLGPNVIRDEGTPCRFGRMCFCWLPVEFAPAVAVPYSNLMNARVDEYRVIHFTPEGNWGVRWGRILLAIDIFGDVNPSRQVNPGLGFWCANCVTSYLRSFNCTNELVRKVFEICPLLVNHCLQEFNASSRWLKAFQQLWHDWYMFLRILRPLFLHFEN